MMNVELYDCDEIKRIWGFKLKDWKRIWMNDFEIELFSQKKLK